MKGFGVYQYLTEGNGYFAVMARSRAAAARLLNVSPRFLRDYGGLPGKRLESCVAADPGVVFVAWEKGPRAGTVTRWPVE